MGLGLRLNPLKRTNRVCVSLSSTEDGRRSKFRNVVFSSLLEFRTTYKVQKPSDSEHKSVLCNFCPLYMYLFPGTLCFLVC
jgi:hypothetical protein